MNVIIFANGELNLPPNWAELLASAKMLIAVDGGAKHLRSLGLRADLLIGDLDSIAQADLASLRKAKVDVLAFPSDKEHSDLELAFREAQKRGADKIFVLAGLGRRWDHSFANILIAAQHSFQNVLVEYLDGVQRLFIIRKAVRLEEKVGARLSLIPISGDALGVKTKGLQYPLDVENLPLGSSRGVSNIVEEPQVNISLDKGMLLCILSPGNLN